EALVPLPGEGPLDRRGGGVREGEVLGDGRLALSDNPFRPPDPEGPAEPLLDLPLEVIVEWDVERDLLAGLDVHVDERPVDPAMTQAPPEVAIAEKLTPVALEGVPGRANPVDRKVGGLELLDEPGARLPLHAAVQTAGKHGRPVLDRDPRLEMNLRAVGGMGELSRREDTR